MTVRDYALDKIRDACKAFDSVAEISLNPFSDKEIKKLVQDEFEINNPLYLDRIVDISKGNPRLAIMASQIAKDSNTLESIRDVSELYDAYYSSIKSDLDALKDKNILRVAGLVAFFRSVDRTDNVIMSHIENEFGITADYFWEAANKLHSMEVADMFENEVVKISDQVLSTYLFYIVFIKEKIINFSILIDDLFPQFKQRLIDAINPILNSFNFEQTKKIMMPEVDNVWNKTRLRDEDTFLNLIDVFWFLKPTETLLFIQEKIESIDRQEISIDEVKFKTDSSSSLPGFLSSLSLFKSLGTGETLTSLDLFLQYAEKQPQDTPKILHCFVNSYGFQPDSYRFDYRVQYAVVEKLIEYCDSGENNFFNRMFIALAENYLQTHFEIARSKNALTVNFIQFDLLESEGLFKLRKLILISLFRFYKVKSLQHHVLKLLASHSQSGLKVTVDSIVEKDSEIVVTFFKNELDPTNLYHCIIVQQYLRILKEFKIPFDKKLKIQFQSRAYEIHDLLTNKFARKELDLSHEEYQEYKKKKINEITAQFSKDDYNSIFCELHNILPPSDQHSKWQIDQGVISIFHELSGRNSNLYTEVIEEYLLKGEILKIDPRGPVSDLISSIASKPAYNIISKHDYPSKGQWLFCYYQYLPGEYIKGEHLSALSGLYTTARHDCFIYDLDYLLKYEDVENGFIVKIITILIDRINNESMPPHALSLIFNKHTKINKYLFSLSSSHYGLLEKAYFLVDKIDSNPDYDGTCFSLFIDNNENFADRYIENKYSEKSYLSKHDGKRDYSFIWQRKDYQSLMNKISEIIFTKGQLYHNFGYLESFFNKNVHPQKDERIIEKQNNYLCNEIIAKHDNQKYMHMIFSVIAGFKSERKGKFYKLFLETNKKFDNFKSLAFNPILSVISNNVQKLQQEIDFYEIIRTFCNSVTYLKHRHFIEQKINALRQEIQSKKKRDFTEEW